MAQDVADPLTFEEKTRLLETFCLLLMSNYDLALERKAKRLARGNDALFRAALKITAEQMAPDPDLVAKAKNLLKQ